MKRITAKNVKNFAAGLLLVAAGGCSHKPLSTNTGPVPPSAFDAFIENSRSPPQSGLKSSDGFADSEFTVVKNTETQTITILAIDEKQSTALQDHLVSLNNGIQGMKLETDVVLASTVTNSNVMVADHQYVAAILLDVSGTVTVKSPFIREMLLMMRCQGTTGPDPKPGLNVLYMSPVYAEKIKPMLKNAKVDQWIYPNWTAPAKDPTPNAPGIHSTYGQDTIPIPFFINRDRSDIHTRPTTPPASPAAAKPAATVTTPAAPAGP